VQYRNKIGESKELYDEAVILKGICQNAKLLINDRLDIALAVDADGVHIGQTDMPYDVTRKLLGKDKIVGVTVHDLEEAIAAEEMGADYLGVSPIFSTDTKKDAGKPSGPSLIKEIKKACKIPVIAIGGINIDNASEVIFAGADMICAISAVVCSDDVYKEVRKFQKLFGL
jgi:thiamine-phosphate pyrophosphorylase